MPLSSNLKIFADVHNVESIDCEDSTTNLQRNLDAEPKTAVSANSVGSRSSRASVSSSNSKINPPIGGSFSKPIYLQASLTSATELRHMPKEHEAHKIAVKDYQFTENMTVDELVHQMEAAWGFTAGKLATGVNIMEAMINDDKCVKILSFTADIVATGTRGVIRELVKRKLVDVIITTCGTLDHDVARCTRDYYKGSFIMSDSKLHQEGVNRLGNVLVPNDSYGIVIEKKILGLLEELYNEGKKELSTMELNREIGLRCTDETSIAYWAAKNNIPIIVPGPTDGSVGYQLWFFSQDHKNFRINILKDEEYLNNLVFDAKKTGALIVGGGISKHHTIWWNQFKDGLDYVVYISTADEWDGSLSGARPREAVSWGKINEKAKMTMIEGDATMVLPVMTAALIDRLSKKQA